MALSFLKENGHAIVNDTYQVPLSFIINDKEISSAEVKDSMERVGEVVNLFPADRVCERLLGKSVYTSTFLLGISYQKGLLPFSLLQLKEAISGSIKR